MKTLSLIFLLLISLVVNGQTPALLKDFNVRLSQGINEYYPVNDKIFFVVGNELWVTDLTSSNTIFLKKISSNKRLCYYSDLSKNIFYFIDSSRLWKSDGTVVGTVTVGNGYTIHPDEYELTQYNGQMVFTAADNIHGYELWTSDGTDQGTRMLVDVDKGLGSLVVIHRTAVGNQLYFSANDSSNSSHLYPNGIWETDGTAFSKVSDTPGYFMFSYNDIIYFIGESLDKTAVYFGKMDVNKKVNIPLCDTVYGIEQFEVINDKIAISLREFSYDVMLYSIDTFGNNLTRLSSMELGNINQNGSFLKQFMVKRGPGELYFLERAGNNAYNLWMTDGTSLGTKKTSYLPGNLRLQNYITGNDNNLFFKAYDTTSKRVEVFYMNPFNNYHKFIHPSTLQLPYSSISNKQMGTIFCFKNNILFTNDYDPTIETELYMVDVSPLAIKQPTISQASVFPNPATDQISISIPHLKELTIFDNIGKKMLTTSEKNIDIRHFVPGMYFLDIQMKNGDRRYGKFIKQ